MKRTAIVTGSSRGIGFAIAKQLGLDGYNIVMVATGPQEKNQAALDELKTQGIDCAYVQANIGSADDRKKILDGALAAFGRVDVLVNNAGVAPKVRADLLDMSEESFDYVVGINTKGNMFLTQLVAKQMISQEPVDGRKGVIVNVSSCSSVVSSTNRSVTSCHRPYMLRRKTPRKATGYGREEGKYPQSIGVDKSCSKGTFQHYPSAHRR